MKFESLNQSSNAIQAEGAQNEIVESDVVEKLERESSSETRFKRLTRLSLAALTFYGVADTAEMLVSRDSGVAAYAAESLTLSDKVSTGTVRLSSGEEISIPKAGELFDRVMVYTPTGKDPDRLLVLFSQIHALDEQQMKGWSADQRRGALEAANDSQHRIYQGLKQLIDDGSLYSVCSEGITQWGTTKSLLQDYSTQATSSVARIIVDYFPGSEFERTVQQSHKDWNQHYATTGDSIKFEEITKTYPEITNYVNKYKYVVGAADLLAAEGEIIPCPGEGAEEFKRSASVAYLFDKPRNEWSAEEVSGFSKLIFEDREDAAIETIMNAVPDNVVGLTYGAAHDFTNNIDAWNVRNPDQQIGLVEIRTPLN